jgi:hypothetical protein
MKHIRKKLTAAGLAMTVTAEKNAMMIEAFILTVTMELPG